MWIMREYIFNFEKISLDKLTQDDCNHQIPKLQMETCIWIQWRQKKDSLGHTCSHVRGKHYCLCVQPYESFKTIKIHLHSSFWLILIAIPTCTLMNNFAFMICSNENESRLLQVIHMLGVALGSNNRYLHLFVQIHTMSRWF